MSFDFKTLVTDRSMSDVLLRNSKGAYNYTDLNRVTAAMDYLNSELTRLGYTTSYKRVEIPRDEGSRLPDGYTELEYIESTGLQYIDPNIPLDIPSMQSLKVVADMAITDTTATSWRVSGAGNTPVVLYFGLRGDSTNTFGYGNSSADATTGVVGDNERHIWELDVLGGSFNISGTDVDISGISFSATTANPYSKFLISAYIESNSGTVRSHAEKIYGYEFYLSGKKFRDLVPCITDTGDVGLYDVVDKVFYGNAGTGKFIAGPAVNGDSNTLFLLHGETIEDNSLFKTVLTNQGVQVSDAQSKFGGKSLYFNGSSSLVIESTNLLNTEYFTIDWWEYRAVNVEWGALLFQPFNEGSGVGFIASNPYANKVWAYVSSNGASWDVASQEDMGSLLIGGWVHRAVVKNSLSILFFENGSLVNTVPCPKSLGYSGRMILGKHNSYFNGYVDEFRISNVARWIEEFTPPDTPYDVQPEPVEPLDPYLWYESDIPTTDLMNQYLGNVNAIREALAEIPGNPDTPTTMSGLTYHKANDIEEILVGVETMLTNIEKTLNLGWALGIADIGLYGGV